MSQDPMSHDRPLIGAIDIGGTKISVGLISEDGLVAAKEVLRTGDYASGQEAIEAIAESLQASVRAANATLCGIGIGCTGPVDPIRGVVGKVALLPGWEGCAIVEELARRCHVTVAMENDADAAAMAELIWGTGQGADRFLYVTLSTGIGTGFVVNGQLYRGVGGSHPEMGHHTIDPSGPPCYCGARGCWESLASGTALREWYRAHDQGKHSLEKSFGAHTVFALYQQGEPLAAEAVDRFCRHVGVGLANLMMILVPKTIAISGGLMQSKALFLDRAVEIARSKCLEIPAELVTLCAAALDQDAGLKGAAAVWMRSREKQL